MPLPVAVEAVEQELVEPKEEVVDLDHPRVAEPVRCRRWRGANALDESPGW